MGLRSQSLSQAQAGEGVWELRRGRPALEKEEGKGEGVEGGGCGTGSGAAARGLGAIGGGLREGSKEEEKSQQGSGDIVLGGCGPERAKSI